MNNYVLAPNGPPGSYQQPQQMRRFDRKPPRNIWFYICNAYFCIAIALLFAAAITTGILFLVLHTGGDDPDPMMVALAAPQQAVDEGAEEEQQQQYQGDLLDVPETTTTTTTIRLQEPPAVTREDLDKLIAEHKELEDRVNAIKKFAEIYTNTAIDEEPAVLNVSGDAPKLLDPIVSDEPIAFRVQNGGVELLGGKLVVKKEIVPLSGWGVPSDENIKKNIVSVKYEQSINRLLALNPLQND